MAEDHKSQTTDLESRKTPQAGDGRLLSSTAKGQGWVWHTAGSQWLPPSARPTLYSEQFRPLALRQPSTGHETKSWLEQLTLHMWFWHYKPSPLGNDFCFVLFVGLFCVCVCPFLIFFFFLNDFISSRLLAFRSAVECLFPLHSSWCSFWNHLHCSHFCPCLKLVSTSPAQTTPHMTADHGTCNCTKTSC